MTDKTGYELFLPAVAAAVASKKKGDRELSVPELKAVVAVTFRDAIVDFIQESLLYRVSISIDLYQGVKRYDIIAPEGFIVEDIIKFQTGVLKVPKLRQDLNSIELFCSPIKDTDRAFYAVLALTPKRASNCEFDDEFVEKHYEVILANMFMRLSTMQNRVWRSLGQSIRYERDYISRLNQAKRRDLNGGGILKLKTKRLSHNAFTY